MFYISHSVRPRIVSFGEILAAPWKSDLVLDCLHVGEPTPKVTWSHQQKPVLENSKHQVSQNDFLKINEYVKYPNNLQITSRGQKTDFIIFLPDIP